MIRSRVRHARSLLDVGCGTGRHMEHLREHDEVEGLDISDALLALARRRLPGVPLHKRDLRSFDLGRRFDVVTCLFSAIGYAETRDGLRAATAALTAHIASKGLLLLEPWVPPADGMRFAEAVGPDPTLAVARAGAGAPSMAYSQARRTTSSRDRVASNTFPSHMCSAYSSSSTTSRR